METQGLSKDQMVYILSCLSEEQLRDILSGININQSPETTAEAPVVEDDFDYKFEEYEDSAYYSNSAVETNTVSNTVYQTPSDTVANMLEQVCLSLDAYRTRYVELTEYLLNYPFSPEIKEELRLLSQGLYDLYQVAGEHNLIKYKICLYQKFVNKVYEEERVPLTPYSEIAHEIAYYFLDRAFSNEWFRKYVGASTFKEFSQKKYDDSPALRIKRQVLLNPIKVDCHKVDEYIKVLKDYAFRHDDMITNNDGDRAVMTVTDRICSSFLKHEDNDNYLSEGLKYYLGEMMNYDLDIS